MPTPSASSAGVTARVVNLFSPPGSWGEETKMTEDEFKDQSWKLPLWAPHATSKLLTFQSSWLSNLPGLNNALPSLKASPKRLSLRNFTALGLWILLIIPRKIPFLNFYFYFAGKVFGEALRAFLGRYVSKQKGFFRTWKSERQYIAGRVPGGLVFGNQKILGFRKSWKSYSWFWWLEISKK